MQDTLGTGNVNSNACMQLIAQAQQTEANADQPPFPLQVIGKGFGYLSGLPQAQANPSNIKIQAYTALPPPLGSGQLIWDTSVTTGSTAGNCQVYIADWTDSAISLLVGLPTSAMNSNQSLLLSPLTDMTPQAFFQPLSQTVACPLVAGNYLQLTVTNPQSLSTGSLAAGQIVMSSSATPY